MNSLSGMRLSGVDHIRQSVADILTTPIGTRVMRREYGFDFDLIDANINRSNIVLFYAAIARALRKWEPRIRLIRVQASGLPEETASGRLEIDLDAELIADGRPIRMEGLVI